MQVGPHAEEENIRVVGRIRSLTAEEIERASSIALRCMGDSRTIQVIYEESSRKTARTARSYTLDVCVSQDASQGHFFDVCGIRPLLASALDGFSSTCFAYGQTGSGKTYSLIGHESVIPKLDKKSSELDGLLSRSVKFLFSAIKRRQEGNFDVFVSYYEVYNEQVRDVLNPSNNHLPIKWNPHQGFYVQNLSEVQCSTKAEVMRYFCEGYKNTMIGTHEMNQRSNRSHCIFTINVKCYKRVDDSEDSSLSQICHGRVSFIDLAGSERNKDTKANGKMLVESSQINKSLFTLGKVIHALSKSSRKNSNFRVPYRDSTLTKLLMHSLGGNSKTLMLACCSPSAAHLSESLRSLEFASRAKNIRNKPVVMLDAKESLINELRTEIGKLRVQNSTLKRSLKGKDQPKSEKRRSRQEASISEQETRRKYRPSTAQKLAQKMRYVISEHKEVKLRHDPREIKSIERASMERDQSLLQELQQLMGEYVVHKSVQLEEEEEEEEEEAGLPSLYERLSRAQEESRMTFAGISRLHDGTVPSSRQAPSEEDDSFNSEEHAELFPEDDKDEEFDEWLSDRIDALEEMRALELELSMEIGQAPLTEDLLTCAFRVPDSSHRSRAHEHRQFRDSHWHSREEAIRSTMQTLESWGRE